MRGASAKFGPRLAKGWAVIALVAVGFAVQAQGAEQKSLFEQATEAYNRGELSAAATLFEQAGAVEVDPKKRALARVWQASSLFFAGDTTGARAALVAALGDDPQIVLRPEYWGKDFLEFFVKTKRELQPSPPPQHSVVQPSASPGETRNAIERLRRQAAQAVDTAALMEILGPLRQVEVSDPSVTLEVLELRADLLERLGRIEEGLEDRGRLEALRAAAAAVPGTSPLPIQTLLDARRMLRDNRPREAAALLRGVLLAQPSSIQALDAYSEALVKAGQLDEAFETVRIALATNENVDLRLRQGEIELARGRPAAARQAFVRAVELDAANDRALTQLGLTAAKLGDVATARDALTRAIKANALVFVPKVVRAQIALLDGDTEVAIELLKSALKVQPDSAWAAGWLGAAYLQLGQVPTAIEHLDEAQRANDPQLQLFLAEALRRSGRVNDAMRVLEQTASDVPDERLIEARCLIDRGELRSAAEVLERLVAVRPEDGRAQYLLAFAYHAEGRWAQARHHLEQARSLTGSPEFIEQAIVTEQKAIAGQELLDRAPSPPPVARRR